jgi:hypothetical protein
MIRNRKLLKAITAFLLVEILLNTVAPAVSWALTAGPTAPEATSFEPVDTTDLVDLKTGDFTYNIPLLEVPGPAGGYPLSLSYHAGIQPDQDASWVGLGFTLNPGSVSRLVNGYPDDHNGVLNVDRVFWEGGETVTSTVGISVGIANVATVSAGLTFAQDTYRGYGEGMYAGLSVGLLPSNSPVNLSANFQAGVSPYGNSYKSAGLSVGISAGSQKAANLGVNIGFDVGTSGISGSGSAGVGVGKMSLMGASINTSSSSVSLSVGGGVSGVHNGKASKVSYNSEGFQVEIPVYPGINIRLGREYQRYWTDETAVAHTFGALYLDQAAPTFTTAFDTYDLLDLNLDIATHDNGEKVLGGSFPDTDFYTVTAQGMSGNIKPYHFQQNLYRQDKKDADDNITAKNYRLSNQALNRPVEFRFLNDFSNRFEYNPPDFEVNANVVSFDFDGDVTSGQDGNEAYSNNHLAGSKHVEWYSNQEILGVNPNVKPFKEGFIDCVAEGFQRGSDHQVGGFSITNATGVTYHYALPAYSYSEYMKSVNTKHDEDGLTFNTLTKPERYAYTWFLTAVTGPDFVDRNVNGLADQGDWGYWVNFEYKKHLSDYKWRNPGEGTNKDLDGEFETYAAGNKEIYYLEKIITESHVAVFEKSLRNDGREVLDIHTGGFRRPITMKSDEEITCLDNCEISYCNFGDCDDEGLAQCRTQCDEFFEDILVGYEYGRSTLKLNNIKVYNYQDFIAQKTSDEYVLRKVGFQYDYSLAPGTPDSFDEEFDEETDQSSGKLTLRVLEFFGKKTTSLVPPMKFDYKNVPYGKDKKDVWGYYKSDFTTAFRDQTNEVIGRITTPISALDVDAWSLNTIETSLGSTIKIGYESDQYEDVILAKQQILRIKEVIDFAEGKLKISFWEDGMILSNYFEPGERIGVDLIGNFWSKYYNDQQCSCDVNLNDLPTGYDPLVFSGNPVVESIDVDNKFLIISDAAYYHRLKYESKSIERKALGGMDNCPDIVTCVITYSGGQAWPDYFSAGIVSVPEKPRYGGGVRVKSISLSNPSGDDRITAYEYEGGSTSYEPFEILSPMINPDYENIAHPIGTKLFYKRAMLKKFFKQIGISRTLPGPGVMYKYVKVREKNITSDNQEHILQDYTQYEFETYQEGMVDVVSSDVQVAVATDNVFDGVHYSNSYLNKVTLKDFSSRVGNLKKITLYHDDGGGSVVPVSETRNVYLHDDLDLSFNELSEELDGVDGSFNENVTRYEPALADKFLNQGLTEETFTRSRIQLFNKYDTKPYLASGETEELFESQKRYMLATISKHELFPSIPIGQINRNYKTGVRTATKNLAFDYYSGEAIKVLTTDSYGNRYLSVSVPAHEHYGGMGLKVNNKANRNMLTQSAEQYSFIVDETNVPTGLLSASIQTWSDQVPVLNLTDPQAAIWRVHASYQWNGEESLNSDGSYKYADFNSHQFNWTDLSVNDKWMKTGELTLYDVYSHGLEAKDLNENYASTRMNREQNKVIASAANARYDEMAYAGAEYYAGNSEKEGGVHRGDGNASKGQAHTGQFGLLVGTNKKGFNYTLSLGKADLTKKYRASVWVYAPGEAESQADLNNLQLYYTLNGEEIASVHPVLQKNKSKSWYLLNLDITPNGTDQVFVGVRNNTQRGVYFDDFRVHPLNGSLTSYVYDPFSGEVNYILDGNNFYTRFEYDAMGRLVRTSKEMLNFDFGAGKESYRADAVLKEVKYNYYKKVNE